jgi:hypothetical protein
VRDPNQQPTAMYYYLREAPNPSDILWENLEATTSQKFWARLGSNVLTLLLVSVSFFCILGLKVLQKNMSERLEKKKSTASSLGLRAISLGVAFIILVINTALSMAIKKLTDMERFSTSTNFFKSMTYKIVFVLSRSPGSIHQHEYLDADCSCAGNVPRVPDLQPRGSHDRCLVYPHQPVHREPADEHLQHLVLPQAVQSKKPPQESGSPGDRRYHTG